MIANFRTHVRAATAGALVVGVALFGVSAAGAQSNDRTAPVSTPATEPATQGGAPSATGTAPAFWELIGGYEADTHGSAYAFFGPSHVHPIRPGLAWTARAFANYLAYEFTDAAGENEVRSPGLSVAGGLRFGDKSFFGVNAGPEVKWRRTEVTGSNGQTTSSSDTVLGANIGAELYANPTSHNNIHGIVNYGTADEYTWARLGFKEQISNRNWQGPTAAFIGVEGIAQGNDDIRSTQVGGFFEVTRVPSNVSVTVRVGYKKSTFDVGPDKTGPYFAVGFYKRLG